MRSIARSVLRLAPAKSRRDLFQCLLLPARAGLSENGLETVFEERASILQILFGVGFCGDDADKRLDRKSVV